MPTATYMLMQERLRQQGYDIERLFVRYRQAGLSYRKIARDLEDLTGVNVTSETIRMWFRDKGWSSRPRDRIS